LSDLNVKHVQDYAICNYYEIAILARLNFYYDVLRKFRVLYIVYADNKGADRADVMSKDP